MNADQARARKKWPEARTKRWFFWVEILIDPLGFYTVGEGFTKAGAWADAARRIEEEVRDEK